MPKRLNVDIPGVTLWWGSRAQPEHAIAAWWPWLSMEEKQRADRMTEKTLQHRAVAVRAQLRWLLAQALDVSPAALRFENNPHGRPQLAPPFAQDAVYDFNLSHSEDRLLIGILHAPTPVTPHPWRHLGIDLESLCRRRDTARLAQRVLTVREQRTLNGLDADAHQRRFLHHWTLKEAFSKAVGVGFTLGFDAMDFEIDATHPSTPVRAHALPTPYQPDDWCLQYLDMGADFIAALALGR